MRPDLEHWLGLHYKARVLRQGEVAEVTRNLRERFAADQSLRQEALDQLARIDALSDLCGGNSQLWRRDFVSWVHREALVAALTP